MSETRAISTDFVPAWQTQADCRRPGYRGTDHWFPKGFTTRKDREQTDDAKATCRACPVAMQCATTALEQREEDGIFGGLEPAQRRSIRRRIARGTLQESQVTQDITATWTRDALGPLVNAYLANTIQHDGGHVVWRGRKTSYTVAGRVFTPAQLAFEIRYSRQPQGHVKATCGEPYCVAAEHLADSLMRWRHDHLAAAA
jgi:WhiB family redox-sensing transcriptional regulator